MFNNNFVKIVLKSSLVLIFLITGFFCFQRNCNAVEFGDVVINEIAWMGTTVSANNEWIELKNTTNSDINLSGWSLVAQDGAPLINLSGIILANEYFLLERTDDTSAPYIKADVIYSGVLSNSGEILGLRDKEKNLIDLVECGKGWIAGDNITKKTMERIKSGSWQTSQDVGGTARAENSIVVAPIVEKQTVSSSTSIIFSTPIVDAISSASSTATTSTVSALSVGSVIAKSANKLGDVVINEFVADPTDNDVEWIEIYNTTNKEINLNNWTIEDGSKTKTNLSGLLGLDADNKFKIINKPEGILNNSGDLIIVKDDFGNLIDQVAYGDWDDGNKSNNAPTAQDPFSVARKFDGYNTYNNVNDFAITIKPTKNTSNIICVDDEVNLETKAKFNFSNDVFISEILPNPVGDDAKSEFIEIYNASQNEVNLIGWSLSNEDGEKINFEKVATSTIIKAGEYLTFFRLKTKIVLHNDQGEARLYQPLTDKPIQIVKYKNVIEGQSYNLILPMEKEQKEYGWSETITRGGINVIKKINHLPKVNFDFPNEIFAGQRIVFDSSDTFDQDDDDLKFNWDFGDGVKLTLSSPEHTFLFPGTFTVSLIVSDGKSEVKKEKIVKVVENSNSFINNYSVKKKNVEKKVKKAPKLVAGVKISKNNIIETTLEKINQCEIGDLLKVKGKVVVKPGILGAQIFYIIGSPSIQIYNYKKEFPDLKVGDYIEVAGELSEANGERRLKTKKLADIRILEHQDTPIAQILSCDKFSEEYVGQLVSVTGEITGRRGSAIYLDDGNDEVEIYIKRAIDVKPASLAVGKTYTVVGVVIKTQSGLKLMPRSKEDIIIQNQSENNTLGNVSADDEWQIASVNKKLELFRYLLIIAGGIIILLLGLIIKDWKKKGP